MTNPRFFDLIEDVDLVIHGEPTRESAEKLAAFVREPALADYAFPELRDPRWMRLLRDSDVFANPPEAQQQRARDGRLYTAYPFWPQSQYIARVAAEDPEAAADVIGKIQGTENPAVHCDILTALASMPATNSERLIEGERKWISRHVGLDLSISEGVVALVKRLGRDDAWDLALGLVSSALEVLPDPTSERDGDAGAFRLPPTPTARIDRSDYGHIASELVSVLLDTPVEAAAEVFSELLQSAVTYSLTPHSTVDPKEDYSYIWYPDITLADIENAQSVRDALVASTRTLLHGCIERERCGLNDLVDRLERRDYVVFQRLALDLLATFGRRSEDTVRERLVDSRLLIGHQFRAEYSRLAREYADVLSHKDREEILRALRNGPMEDSRIEEWLRDIRGEVPSKEDVRRYRLSWQRDQLQQFAGAGSEFDKAIRQLNQELPPVDEESAAVGYDHDESPVKVGDMPTEALIEFVAAYDSKNARPLYASYGFTSDLQAFVTGSLFNFEDLSALRRLGVPYATTVLYGLRQLVQTRTVEWDAVLDFVRWTAVEASRNQSAEAINARRAGIQLVESALASKSETIPDSYRDLLWEIIRSLTDDPDSGTSDPVSVVDATSLSINVVRGVAMHAVVRYALWVRNSSAADVKPTLDNGLEEVAVVLDRHLDPRVEHSAAVRSVYGQWFPWLLSLGPKWAPERAYRIFGERLDDDLARTAWASYLGYSQPYDAVLDALHTHYAAAIRLIGTWKDVDSSRVSPDRRLAEHLAAYYWRGRLASDETKNLLAEFYDRAAVTLRRHVMEFIGHSLSRTKEVDSKVAERLRNLCEYRIAAVEANPADGSAEELTSFGWWFPSPHFPADWSIDRLLSVLRLTNGRIDQRGKVVERLAEIAAQHPLDAVQALGLIELSPTDFPRYWVTETRKILEIAIDTGSAEAKAAADSVIQQLGRERRRFDLRDLAARVGG